MIVVGGERREVTIALQAGRGYLRGMRLCMHMQCFVTGESVRASLTREALRVAAGASLPSLAPRLRDQRKLRRRERGETQWVEADVRRGKRPATVGQPRQPRTVTLQLVTLSRGKRPEAGPARRAPHHVTRVVAMEMGLDAVDGEESFVAGGTRHHLAGLLAGERIKVLR